MSMLETIETLAREFHNDQKKRYDETPYEERVKFIEGRGWKTEGPKTIEFQPGKPVTLQFWEHPKNSGMGLPLELAWKSEQQALEIENRKKAIEDRTAECSCTKCGANMKKMDTDAEGTEFCVGYYGLVDAELSGGYYSEDLSDLTSYRFSLCEKCVAELFMTFKKPPEVFTYL